MSRFTHSLSRLSGAVLTALAIFYPIVANASTIGIKQEKIGIYDLKAIHAIPLDPVTISKTEENGIIFEKVRFSSIDNIRVFAILSYRKDASKFPGMLIVDRFRAKAKPIEAGNNYFAISVAPPEGNMDENKDDTVGGPRFSLPFSIDDQFTENPDKSYIYQHTVALLRTLDYLETRPEIDLSKTVVTGFSWPGLMVATLHGLDDRPCAYVLFHGLGYYADENGMSGGQPALLSRKAYEMYGAGTYAPLGTKPLYVGVALDDFFTKLDTIMEVYKSLKCEKAFAYAPNRTHDITGRDEFNGQYPWQTYWQIGTNKPSTISEGTVTADGGKLKYSCTVVEKSAIKWSEILVSYGKPGNWMGRTWHSFPLVMNGSTYEAEIPVYDPSVPLYVVGQVCDSSAPKGSTIGNGVQLIDPGKLGISAATGKYPHILFDPSAKSDLYLRTGSNTWSEDSSDGKGSVEIDPAKESTVLFQNIEPNLWQGAKTLHIWMKGDGKVGALTAYLTYDGNYFLDKIVKSYTAFPLVAEGQTMATGWKQYSISVGDATNLDRVSLLFLEHGGHKIQLGTISWD